MRMSGTNGATCLLLWKLSQSVLDEFLKTHLFARAQAKFYCEITLLRDSLNDAPGSPVWTVSFSNAPNTIYAISNGEVIEANKATLNMILHIRKYVARQTYKIEGTQYEVGGIGPGTYRICVGSGQVGSQGFSFTEVEYLSCGLIDATEPLLYEMCQKLRIPQTTSAQAPQQQAPDPSDAGNPKAETFIDCLALTEADYRRFQLHGPFTMRHRACLYVSMIDQRLKTQALFS
eukprot:gnl/Trimastix_PCT/4476.p1 GENE.gnl/Trimastix_PCT/4476~~gnl/Trimastix_PCT/4476.p1  ORF type:complete len:232 (-),score=21.26 gnl/Trimastix_PCT/4476:16-711(-)